STVWSARSCCPRSNGGTSKSRPRKPGRYASGKQTISAPRAAASERDCSMFSRHSSTEDATRGEASAMIMDGRRSHFVGRLQPTSHDSQTVKEKNSVRRDPSQQHEIKGQRFLVFHRLLQEE